MVLRMTQFKRRLLLVYLETAEPGLVEVQKYIEALELGKQNQFALHTTGQSFAVDGVW